MVDETLGELNAGQAQEVLADIFSTETAVTLGGVFGGVSLGETIGALIDMKWSGMAGLGVNVAAKSGGMVLTRTLTAGRPTWDGIGVAMSAGLGVSAIADVIEFASGSEIGYEALSDTVAGGVPQLGIGTKAPKTGGKKSKMSERKVPIEEYEEEPVEGPQEVL